MTHKYIKNYEKSLFKCPSIYDVCRVIVVSFISRNGFKHRFNKRIGDGFKENNVHGTLKFEYILHYEVYFRLLPFVKYGGYIRLPNLLHIILQYG